MPAASDIQLRSAWFEPSIHSAYFQILARLMARRGMGAPRSFVGQPRLLPLLDYLPMFDAVHAVDRAEIGIDVGYAIPAAAHGPMGLAALSSATIGSSLHTIARYAPIRNRLFDYQVRTSDGRVALVMAPRLSFGGYGRFLHYATLFAIFNIFRAVLEEAALGEALLTFPWPVQGPDPQLPPGCVWQQRYGAKQLTISFPVTSADFAFEGADAQAHERVRQLCEEELARLDGSMAATVRHFIHRQQPNWPSVDDAAVSLGTSRRTLLRRLEEEGLGYQQLLDEARNELACWYLRHTTLALAEISEQLGFVAQAGFSRAFRRWQGITAREYRDCFRQAPSAS